LPTFLRQPPVEEFDDYARDITTNVFIVGHLGASVFGAAPAGPSRPFCRGEHPAYRPASTASHYEGATS